MNRILQEGGAPLMDEKHLNITIPVFNRLEETRITLMSLKKNTRHWPHSITVVDNGSEQPVREYLVKMKEAGIIDHLYLLDFNAGVAGACNIGWQMMDAPFYMKLDNDMRILSDRWLENIFGILSLAEPQSTLGPAFGREVEERSSKVYESPYGRFSICNMGNLRGCAILIPKSVSDAIGYWNDDYKTYGAEDGDYGIRMRCSGLIQYQYEANALMEHMDGKYQKPWFNKKEMVEELHGVQENEQLGLITVNGWLFCLGLRDMRPLLKYEIEDIDGCRVRLKQSEAHKRLADGLQECSKLLYEEVMRHGEAVMEQPEVLERLRRIMLEHGGLTDHPPSMGNAETG